MELRIGIVAMKLRLIYYLEKNAAKKINDTLTISHEIEFNIKKMKIKLK